MTNHPLAWVNESSPEHKAWAAPRVKQSMRIGLIDQAMRAQYGIDLTDEEFWWAFWLDDDGGG